MYFFAKSSWWVITTTVFFWFLRVDKFWKNSSANFLSIPLVGSSKKIIFASFISAKTIPSLWSCPPDNSSNAFFLCSKSPTCFKYILASVFFFKKDKWIFTASSIVVGKFLYDKTEFWEIYAKSLKWLSSFISVPKSFISPS